MATTFYPLSEPAPVAVTGGTKAGSLPKALNVNEAGSATDKWLADTNPSAGNNVTLTIPSNASITQQSQYFGRWCSNPLQAQTIPAQTWNWALFMGETNASANTFLWPVMYVYRPSTSSVVGYIHNTAAQGGTELAATAATSTRSYTGGASVVCLDDDILVVEIWTVATQGAATSYNQTLRSNGGGTTAAALSFISSPYTILFKPVPWSILAMKSLSAIGQTADDVEVLLIAGSWGAPGGNVTGPAKWDNLNTRGVVGTGVGGTYPPIGNLTDTFDDLSKWTATNPAGYSSVATGGELVQSLPATTPYAYTQVASNGDYSLLESSCAVKCVQPPQGTFTAYGTECYFQVCKKGVSNTWIGFQWSSATGGSPLVYAAHNTGGTTTNVTGTTTQYNATNHKWLRVRHTAGMVYWEVGPDIAGPVGPVAALAEVEDADSLTADGTLGPLPRAGTLTESEDTDALTATSTNSTGAIVSRTEGNDVPTSAGTVVAPPARTATLNLTEGTDGTTFAGTVVNPPARTATAVPSEDADALASAGTVVFPPARTAVVDKGEDADAPLSSGTVVFPPARTATVDKGEDADGLSALAGPIAGGDLSIGEANDGLVATGTVVTPTTLYFADVVPAFAPTAGDKATYWPGTYFQNNYVPEASLTTVAPTGNEAAHQSLISFEYIGPVSAFFGRFSSAPLAAQTIPAQSWTYAPKVSTSVKTNFQHAPVLYVWRPSTNAVVGYIFDSPTVLGLVWPTTGAAQQAQTFAGGASVPCQDGDILVMEAWGPGNEIGTSGGGGSWYSNSAVSAILSPYALQFKQAPGALTATLDKTEDADALSSTSSIDTSATLNLAEGSEVPTIAGTVVNPAARTATLTKTEADDAPLSAGTVVFPAGRTAVVDRTEGADVPTVTSVNSTGASVSKTEADDALASGGTVVSPVGRTATLATQEDSDAIGSAGTVAAQGSRSGVLDKTEDSDVPTVTAAVGTGASVSKTEANDVPTVTAAVGTGAAVSKTEADDTLGAAATIGGVGIAATVAVTEDSDGVQTSASTPRTATLSLSEDNDVFIGHTVHPKKRVSVYA